MTRKATNNADSNRNDTARAILRGQTGSTLTAGQAATLEALSQGARRLINDLAIDPDYNGELAGSDAKVELSRANLARMVWGVTPAEDVLIPTTKLERILTKLRRA